MFGGDPGPENITSAYECTQKGHESFINGQLQAKKYVQLCDSTCYLKKEQEQTYRQIEEQAYSRIIELEEKNKQLKHILKQKNLCLKMCDNCRNSWLCYV